MEGSQNPNSNFISAYPSLLNRNTRADRIMDRNVFQMSFGKKKKSEPLEEMGGGAGPFDRNSFLMNFGKRSAGEHERMNEPIFLPTFLDTETRNELFNGDKLGKKNRPSRFTWKRLDRNVFPIGFGRR